MRDVHTLQSDFLAAMHACDPTALEDAVYAAFEANLPGELAPLLAEALLLPWHFRHEDIATALGRMKDPRAVDALASAALTRPTYLIHHRGALAKKCVAALAAIGDSSARTHLEQLAGSIDADCADAARRRLASIPVAAPVKAQR